MKTLTRDEFLNHVYGGCDRGSISTFCNADYSAGGTITHKPNGVFVRLEFYRRGDLKTVFMEIPDSDEQHDDGSHYTFCEESL